MIAKNTVEVPVEFLYLTGSVAIQAVEHILFGRESDDDDKKLSGERFMDMLVEALSVPLGYKEPEDVKLMDSNDLLLFMGGIEIIMRLGNEFDVSVMDYIIPEEMKVWEAIVFGMRAVEFQYGDE